MVRFSAHALRREFRAARQSRRCRAIHRPGYGRGHRRAGAGSGGSLRCRQADVASAQGALRRDGGIVDIRRGAMRNGPNRRALWGELLRRHAGHDYRSQGVGQRLSGIGAVVVGWRRGKAQVRRHGHDIRRRPHGVRGRRSGDRHDRIRIAAGERASSLGVHPRELRHRPGHRRAGRGLPAGPENFAPCQGSAGGAARQEHPHRHQRGSEHFALAAGVYPERGSRRSAERRLGENFRVNRFLNLADFSREQILDLLNLAQALQDKPDPRALAGKILGLVFLNPSLRTLASFQAGMVRLGGSSFVITPGQGTWQLETRLNAIMKGAAAEHIREGIPVLASYCDALGVRAFAEGKNLKNDIDENLFRMIDTLCDKPLINMESAMNHPCQALADWRTLDELEVPRRAKFVLSWVYHPKALPLAVPAATLQMAAMRGMDVVVARPEGFALPPEIMAKARLAAATAGGSVTETSDRAAALAGAGVLYAKEWGTTQYYGDVEADLRLRADLSDWCVRERWFAPALPDAKLMHCLPVRRNVAVADEVLDGPRAVVKREAFNRLAVQMAVLHRMLS